MISDRRLRLLRQTAQLLHRPRRSSPADVVRTLAGVQAQDPFAAPLALRARTRGLSSHDVSHALARERSIVRTWAMRGTLHLLCAEDLHWIVRLTAEGSFAGARRRLAQLGVPVETQDRAVRAIQRVLAAEGPLTRAEIAERLRRRRIRTDGRAAVHVIRLAALDGIACYGPERGGQPSFVAVRDWIGPWNEDRDRDSALKELALRYVASHGPAGPDDFASWSGLRAGDVRRAWALIGPRIVEVPARGGSLWTLRSRARVVGTPASRLVPAFDPYLLGWRSRELSVPKRHERRVYPGGGLLRPTALADGLAVGTWTVTRREDPVRVALKPFARLTASVRAALDRDAEDVAGFLDPAAGRLARA